MSLFWKTHEYVEILYKRDVYNQDTLVDYFLFIKAFEDEVRSVISY